MIPKSKQLDQGKYHLKETLNNYQQTEDILKKTRKQILDKYQYALQQIKILSRLTYELLNSQQAEETSCQKMILQQYDISDSILQNLKQTLQSQLENLIEVNFLIDETFFNFGPILNQNQIMQSNNQNINSSPLKTQFSIQCTNNNTRLIQETIVNLEKQNLKGEIKEKLISKLKTLEIQSLQHYFLTNKVCQQISKLEYKRQINLQSRNIQFSKIQKKIKINILKNGTFAEHIEGPGGFIFCEPQLNNDVTSIIQFSIINCQSVSLGICQNEMILEDDFNPFMGNIEQGIYMIDNQGTCYSSNNQKINNNDQHFTIMSGDIVIQQVDIKQKKIIWKNQRTNYQKSLNLQRSKTYFVCLYVWRSSVSIKYEYSEQSL